MQESLQQSLQQTSYLPEDPLYANHILGVSLWGDGGAFIRETGAGTEYEEDPSLSTLEELRGYMFLSLSTILDEKETCTLVDPSLSTILDAWGFFSYSLNEKGKEARSFANKAGGVDLGSCSDTDGICTIPCREDDMGGIAGKRGQLLRTFLSS